MATAINALIPSVIPLLLLPQGKKTYLLHCYPLIMFRRSLVHRRIKLHISLLINPPSHYRYKLVITAADETGDTKFVMFGRIAQRLIKKTVDTLVADNPPGFIPDEITRLLEKVYTLNVSFTDNTISSGNISFQVNNVVAQIDDGNPLPLTPLGPQSSSGILSQGTSSSVRDTPEKDSNIPLQLAPTPQSSTNHDKDKVKYSLQQSAIYINTLFDCEACSSYNPMP
jgi:hypothetical protein